MNATVLLHLPGTLQYYISCTFLKEKYTLTSAPMTMGWKGANKCVSTGLLVTFRSSNLSDDSNRNKSIIEDCSASTYICSFRYKRMHQIHHLSKRCKAMEIAVLPILVVFIYTVRFSLPLAFLNISLIKNVTLCSSSYYIMKVILLSEALNFLHKLSTWRFSVHIINVSSRYRQ